mmetsp:Transcript_9173/g.30587  ORF Transcript_9173/g.30587 Transcript_9173/m.30587 type:complete len:331 (-) Transcript_9173:1655-2647(-)
MSTTSTSRQAKTIGSTTRETRQRDEDREEERVFLPQESRMASNTVRKQAMTSMNFVEAPGAGMLHRLALHGSAQVHELLALRLPKAVMPELDVNASDDSGMVPLHYAASNGQREACEALIEKKALVDIQKLNTGYTPLHFACESGSVETVEYLIAHRADVNARSLMQDATQQLKGEGRTPLHAAVSRGSVEVIQLLLQGRQVDETKVQAKVDTPDGSGNTALHHAAAKADRNVIILLLRFRASIEAKNSMGETPLYAAVTSRNISVVEELLRRKADPNAMNVYSQNPLHYCAKAIMSIDRRIKPTKRNQDFDDIVLYSWMILMITYCILG